MRSLGVAAVIGVLLGCETEHQEWRFGPPDPPRPIAVAPRPTPPPSVPTKPKPVTVTPPPPMLIASAPRAAIDAGVELPTRAQLVAMFNRRDTECGTEDPWARFVSGSKTPEVIALLKAWADDATAPETERAIALGALSESSDPSLLPFWKTALEQAPVHGARRRIAVVGFARSGGERALEHVMGLLGEDDALDKTILAVAASAGWPGRSLETARAHARKTTTSATTKKAATIAWLEATRGPLTDERSNLLRGTDLELAFAAFATTTPSARSLTLGLDLLRRAALPKETRELVETEFADQLGEALADGDAGVIALARAWAASTDPVLLQQPFVQLALANQLQVDGDLRGAERTLVRNLSSAGDWSKEPFRIDRSAVFASMELVLACQLEGEGKRSEAREWQATLQRQLGGRAANLARAFSKGFFGLGSATCAFERLRALSEQPLSLDVRPRRVGGRLELRLTLSNAGPLPVLVSVCRQRSGVVLFGRYEGFDRGAPLEVELPCSEPEAIALEPGRSLTSSVFATTTSGTSLRPARSPNALLSVELNAPERTLWALRRSP